MSNRRRRATTGNTNIQGHNRETDIHAKILTLKARAAEIKASMAKTCNNDEKAKKGMRVVLKRIKRIERAYRDLVGKLPETKEAHRNTMECLAETSQDCKRYEKESDNIFRIVEKIERDGNPENIAYTTYMDKTKDPNAKMRKGLNARDDKNATLHNMMDIEETRIVAAENIIQQEIVRASKYQRKLEKYIKSRKKDMPDTNNGRLAKGLHSALPFSDDRRMIEDVESIITDKKKMYGFTGLATDEFEDTCKRLARIINNSPDAVHFTDNQRTVNRAPYKLSVRYALFLSLVKRAVNLPNPIVKHMLHMNAYSVSPYLKLLSKYDNELYIVTPGNMTRYIATVTDRDDLRRIISGEDGREMSVYGTRTIIAELDVVYTLESPVPSIRPVYSIASLSNKEGYVVGISEAVKETQCDIQIADDTDNFASRQENIANGITSKRDQIRVIADAEKCRILEYFLGDAADRLCKMKTDARLQRNRMSAENLFEYVKNWKVMYGNYEGTAEKFQLDFNAICGIHNMHKMHLDGTYDYWCEKIKSALGTQYAN